MKRFFKRLFRVMSGALDITGEKLLTMNEGSIRAIFRVAKNKLIKTHTALRTNLVNILTLIEARSDKLCEMEQELDTIKLKIKGAESKAKEDSKYRMILSNLLKRKKSIEGSIETHNKFIDNNKGAIDKYTMYLLKVQNKIDEIEFNEEQTVADIEIARSSEIIRDIVKSKVKIAAYKNDDLAIVEKARKRALMAMRVDEYQTDIEEELYQEGVGLK